MLIKDIYGSPDLWKNTTALGTYSGKELINHRHTHTDIPPHTHTPTDIPPQAHTHNCIHKKKSMPEARRQKIRSFSATDKFFLTTNEA